VSVSLAVPASPYRVYGGDAERDQDKVLRAWRECGSDYSRAFADGDDRYKWFYLQNPAGRAQVFFLEHTETGRLVGVTGVGTREIWRRGALLRAGILVDFVVHPDHRIFYPALLLQMFVRGRATDEGRLLIGHPNEISRAILRRAGYRDLQFSRYARVVGYSDHLARFVPRAVAAVPGLTIESIDRIVVGLRRRLGARLEWRWATRFDERYDSLWEARRTGEVSIGCRSRRFLEWRFMEEPNHNYRLLEFSRPKSAALLGYCVCEADSGTLTIADALLPVEPLAQRDALLALVPAARQAGMARISIAVAGDDALRRSLVASGFVKRDAGTLSILDCSGPQCAPASGAGADFYFTMADLDM